MRTIYNSTKAKRNSHTNWQYAQYITIRVNMERVFEVTVSPHTCTYSTLLICAIYVSHLLSLSPRPDPPLLLVTLCCTRARQALVPCHTRAHQALDYLYKSMSYFEGLFAHLPLLASISLHPTWKDSLLSFLDRLWRSYNSEWSSNPCIYSTLSMYHAYHIPSRLCVSIESMF